MERETEPYAQASINAEEQTRVQLRHRVGFNDSSWSEGRLTELDGPALRKSSAQRERHGVAAAGPAGKGSPLILGREIGMLGCLP